MAEPIPKPELAMDDASVALRVAAGDRHAFEWLMRRHNRRLYRLARAALRDEAEAQDVLQDAYLSAYRTIGQFRGEATLATWLSRIVLNQCLMRKRRASRRQNVIPIVGWDAAMEDIAAAVDESERPDSASARAQMRSVLELKVSELPEPFRVVFVMRSVEELSVEETAQCLGVPEETVRTRHFRARSLLRESLARELDVAERDIFDFLGARCDAIVAQVLARLDSPSS